MNGENINNSDVNNVDSGWEAINKEAETVEKAKKNPVFKKAILGVALALGIGVAAFTSGCGSKEGPANNQAVEQSVDIESSKKFNYEDCKEEFIEFFENENSIDTCYDVVVELSNGKLREGIFESDSFYSGKLQEQEQKYISKLDGEKIYSKSFVWQSENHGRVFTVSATSDKGSRDYINELFISYNSKDYDKIKCTKEDNIKTVSDAEKIISDFFAKKQ